MFPPHGSAGAVLGFRSVVITFTAKIAMETAMTNAPVLEMKFSVFHPRSGA